MQRKRLGLLLLVSLILFMAVFAFGLNVHNAYAVNNGLAVTPPMGWNDWNKYGCSISDSLIRRQADAMVSSGMKAAGYQYINIDDCWLSKSRDGNGNVVPDPSKFPNGMKALADYVHSQGLKLGIYTDAGTATCAGFPGMYGHEQQDANTYASWGIDYIKVDWCNSSGIDAQTQYTKIGNALKSTGRAITFSLCDWGQSNVWTWGPSVGNLWRTTGDITDTWSSMLSNFDSNASHASSAGPGGWNDPDMLEIGNGGMSTTEYQAHFSLWAISAAPLITGTDLSTMSATTKSILINTDVIAVDQDTLGVQGTKVSDSNGLQVWSKKLQGGSVAVVLLNRNTSAASITANWSNIGISGSASVRDLWSHTNVGSFNGSYTANVVGHGVVMLKISPGSTGGPTPTPTSTPTAGFNPNPNSHYRIVNRNSGQVLDVAGASIANGALIDQWPSNGGANQLWRFVAVNGGYKLVNVNSSKVLEDPAGSTTNGTRLDQASDSSSSNQWWNVVSQGSGYYSLVDQKSGQYVDVTGASTANGAAVIQWPGHGGTNQQWSLVQVS